jgi:hypothetical protein
LRCSPLSSVRPDEASSQVRCGPCSMSRRRQWRRGEKEERGKWGEWFSSFPLSFLARGPDFKWNFKSFAISRVSDTRLCPASRRIHDVGGVSSEGIRVPADKIKGSWSPFSPFPFSPFPPLLG